MSKYLTAAQLKALPIGARVVFPNGAEAYPDFLLHGPITGNVASHEHDCTWVKLDKHEPELDEWENQIQVWFWESDGTSASEEIGHDIETA